MLSSENISLRTPQDCDVDVILKWENNFNNWEVSGTRTPYTKEEIDSFIKEEHSLIANKQIRYIICFGKSQIGTIDLFEYDSIDNSVGVGILIAEEKHRRRGYASESLALLLNYCSNELGIVNVFCNIQKNNEVSICFFEKNGFQFLEERELFGETVNYYEKKL